MALTSVLGIDDTYLYYAGLHCSTLAFSRFQIDSQGKISQT